MFKSDKLINLFLALMAAVLLGLCVMSVVNEQQSVDKRQHLTEHGRE
ncbi:MAG: hypothetical protein K6D91_04165 [Prevotella sp.]|nr:hypothetical protein [Prevotella sp.]